MITSIIIHYLETNKRIVVPDLGAFIVKIPHQEVIFTELLKKDDGVLLGLLVAQGVKNVEALGLINRFVFEVKHAVKSSGSYTMRGFGDLTDNENGAIGFVYKPQLQSAPEAEQPKRHIPTKHSHASVEADAVQAEQTPNAEEGKSFSYRNDEYVKGLRYSKPHKSTAPYSYVGSESKPKVDKFVVVAVVAAIIATLAITYSLFRDNFTSSTDAEVYPQPELVQDSLAQDDSLRTELSPVKTEAVEAK